MNKNKNEKKSQRRARTKNHYFTKVHEDAIVQYTAVETIHERTVLYEKFIQPAFNELVDKIVYTYKFTNLPNIDSLREECKIWLTTILDKYDPNKGSKAFSYFSVITKNWFIHKVKKNALRTKREISLDVVAKELERKYISDNISVNDERERREFWEFLLKEINDWQFEAEQNNNLSTNDMRVLKAIRVLLENSQEITILNKKAIYLYLREITSLNTKQIATSLKKFRIRYKVFKQEWNSGNI